VKFSNYFIDLMLFHVKPEDLARLFNRYHIDVLEYSYPDETVWSGFPDKLKNFLNSIPDLRAYGKSSSVDVAHHLGDMTGNLFGNFLILLSRASMYSYIDSFLIMKGKDLGVERIEQWLLWALDNLSTPYLNEVIDCFPRAVASAANGYLLQNPSIVHKVIELLKDKNDTNSNSALIQMIILFPVANDDLQNQIRNIAEERLSASFDAELYYIAALFEVIDFRPSLDDFVSTIPPTDKIAQHSFHFGEPERNTSLDKFINLAYKYEINLKDKKYEKLHQDNLYYKWLLDLENFDYAHFNPYWLLKYKTKYYFKEFRKVSTILKSLNAALRKKPNEGLSRIYTILNSFEEN
jgi:hypothetical protein